MQEVLLLLFLHFQTKSISILTGTIFPLWDLSDSFYMKRIEIAPVEKIGWL